ncbi:MAG: hypothetical protein Q9172_001540 [Xanthocarpia lactea]
MNLKTVRQAVLIVWCYITFGNAFILDQSCTSSDAVRRLVTSGINDAMQMAERTVQELSRIPWAVQDDQDLINLATWIFKDPGTAPQQDWAIPDPRNNLDKVRNMLVRLLEMKIERTSGRNNEVIIYCDLSRLKSTKIAGRLFDSIAKVFALVPGNNNGIAVCVNSMAWTAPSNAGAKPSEMQICPQYIEKQMHYHWHSPKTLNKPLLEVPRLNDRVEMDAWTSTIDSTILHELTHTTQGGMTNDVGGTFGAYGWKNVLRMSQSAAAKNADSIAIFATGVRMITRQGLIPQKDGSVIRA